MIKRLNISSLWNLECFCREAKQFYSKNLMLYNYTTYYFKQYSNLLSNDHKFLYQTDSTSELTSLRFVNKFYIISITVDRQDNSIFGDANYICVWIIIITLLFFNTFNNILYNFITYINFLMLIINIIGPCYFSICTAFCIMWYKYGYIVNKSVKIYILFSAHSENKGILTSGEVAIDLDQNDDADKIVVAL